MEECTELCRPRISRGRAYSPLRWIGKSAEVIDGKGVAMAPLCKRVRIVLEVKEIKEVEEVQERVGGIEHSVGNGGGKSWNRLSRINVSVNTPISD